MTSAIQNNQTTQSFWAKYGFIWFILPFLALPLFTRGISILSSISLVIAIILLAKHYRFVTTEVIKNRYLYLFLALFIPVLISLIDALTPALTTQTLWRMIRFAGYAVIALFVFQNHSARERFMAILFWILILYCLDAICQWAFDYNIYGYNPASNAWQNRIRGVFGDRYDLSFFLATLSPMIFYYLFEKVEQRQKIYIYLTPFLLFIFLFTILLGGARSALISLAISIFLFIAYIIYQKKIKNYKYLGIGIILLAVALLLVAPQIDVITARYLDTIKQAENLNQLTTNRVNIWNVAWSEFPNHWLTGVGVRGFNALYQSYPESYKIFDQVNSPHLQGLEVLIETGLIGFIPYIFVCLYLLITFFRSNTMNPWMLIVLLAMMPINTYSSLYEGNWLPFVMISLAIATTFSNLSTPTSQKKE